jgi:hypothetical protein
MLKELVERDWGRRASRMQAYISFHPCVLSLVLDMKQIQVLLFWNIFDPESILLTLRMWNLQIWRTTVSLLDGKMWTTNHF